jgi:hypothetical protein
MKADQFGRSRPRPVDGGAVSLSRARKKGKTAAAAATGRYRDQYIACVGWNYNRPSPKSRVGFVHRFNDVARRTFRGPGHGVLRRASKSWKRRVGLVAFIQFPGS